MSVINSIQNTMAEKKYLRGWGGGDDNLNAQYIPLYDL